MNSYKYGARSVEASRPGGSGASYYLRATAPFAACNKMHWLGIKPSQLTSILPTGAVGSDISLQDKTIIHNLQTFYTTLPNKEFANEVLI